MNITGQDCAAVVIELVGVLVLTALALIGPSDRSAQPEATERRVAATTALDIELARCKALGQEARDDDACQKAWRIVSNRFFEYGELHHGLAVNRSREGAGREEGASHLPGERTGTQDSPSRPDPALPLSSASVAGQPQ